MSVRVEVELDIFSGMPNPTWVLTDAEADSFLKQLAMVPRTPATKLSGNLGYRGFIVQVLQDDEKQTVHLQTGHIRFTEGATIAYGIDNERDLERWLLQTGKTYLKNELFQQVERNTR